MRSARIRSLFSVGLLVGLCGCYHYGYYGSPYGPQPYPLAPTYPPPGVVTPVPGTPYVPGPSPTPLTPNGGSPPQWQPGDTPLPGNPNRAPVYEPNGNSPVPNPTTDPDEQDFGTSPGARLTPAPSQGSFVGSGSGSGSGAGSGSGIELQPIEAAASPPTLARSNDPFEVPAKSVSANNTVAARPPIMATRPNPYAHQRDFAWLRGVVDYDAKDQRWVIIYDNKPSASDRFGGSFTLSDHPHLRYVRPDDVIVVDGHIDYNSVDLHGKPLYHVDKVQLMKPSYGY